MTGFALHPEAFDDIDEIRAYIAEDNPAAADRTVNEIFDQIRQLIAFPNQGFHRPNLTPLPLRFCPCPRLCNRVCFREKPLWIVAVFHGRRGPRVIAAILRGRE